jgi:hypothetical protein
VVTALSPRSLSAQQQTAQYTVRRDVIHGRVAADSGRALAGAEVAITMAPDRTTQFAKSDSAGRYEVVFEKGTGDYLVHVAALGRKTFRKRITRTGGDSVFTVDAVLPPNVQQLPAVAVAARRQKVARETGGFPTIGVGAAEQIASTGVTATLSPDQRGNVDALATTVPGVSAVPGGGVSTLGLPPTQNTTTLNGLAFGGGSIPRAVNTQARVTTSTYDPARGGFSGAQTQITLAPAGQFTNRRGFATFDSPALQATDAVADRAGAAFTSVDLNFGTEGATNMDRWVYNSGIQLRRRYSDVVSLLSANGDVLRHSGVASDSVARLLAALAALGIPTTSGGVPGSRTTDYVAFIGRLDRPLFDYNTFTPLNTTWGVTGFANYAHTGALNFSPTATPAHGGESAQMNAGFQGVYSAYFGKQKDELNDVRSGISVSRVTDSPYISLPDGRVLVSSSFTDGTGGVASLGFAGSGAPEATRTTATWESTNETQLYWKGSATHRGKIYLNSRLDSYVTEPISNQLGSFSFNSIADLAANRPASFSRTLAAPRRTGGAWTGAASIGDNWVPSQRFSMIYGARAEANVFTRVPAYNPDIDRLFGVRTNTAPNTWHASPRVGFNWVYTSARQSQGGSSGLIGTFYTVPKGVIRGGVGEFRQLLDPALLSEASVMTGLPGSNTRVSCVGAAVPIPDWPAYAATPVSVPSRCASGASFFSDSASNVLLFDKHYQPASSWRSNLSWSSSFKAVQFVVDGVFSFNVHQPSSRDLNFARLQYFTLADEGGRPVFVPTASIVPGTAAIATSASRVSQQYAQVFSRTSDLRSWARQGSLRLRPNFMFVGRWLLDATYTYADVRSQSRGFDGATFGDPLVVTWARGDFSPRHEITTSAGYASSWVAFTLFGKVSSGQPFTPMIASDVNGDGLANDRAFVFDPLAVKDVRLAQQMSDLFGSTSSRSRDCLTRQLGHAAERNGCEGPWTASFNASIAPGGKLYRKLQRVSIIRSMSINLSNPLGGLDQLMHGSNTRGWGTPSFPDRVLYYARGFDSTSKRFVYDVNPRFGNTRPSATTLRVPFRATIDVQLDFGRPIDEQQIQRMLRNGRNGNPGAKLDSAAIVRRYCGNLPDWYNEIIQQTDSLLLTRDQVETLRDARAKYLGRVMAHWGEFARYLAAVPDRFDNKELAARQKKVTDDAWEIARQEAQSTLPKILTTPQLNLLPGNSGFLYKAKQPITGVRYFSSNSC